jgi:hypothetical protein
MKKRERKERSIEARNLLDIIMEHEAELNSQELGFVESLSDRMDRYLEDTNISDKQLFWLRDIKDKYL